ncbi:unnamed protein product, partial [Amoebophrya sp. A25]|eukprot:GSA25T00016635001.1
MRATNFTNDVDKMVALRSNNFKMILVFFLLAKSDNAKVDAASPVAPAPSNLPSATTSFAMPDATRRTSHELSLLRKLLQDEASNEKNTSKEGEPQQADVSQ